MLIKGWDGVKAASAGDLALWPAAPLAMAATTFTVTQTSPRNAAHDVAQSATISVTFSLLVSATIVTSRTFTVRGSLTGDYAGAFSFDANSVQFNPAQDFWPGEEIVVNLSSSIQATNGISLTPYAWSFRAAVVGGNGVFTDSGRSLGNSNSMDVALGDVDGDGDLDLLVGNRLDQPNRLYLNNGTADPWNGVSGLDITSDTHSTYSVALGDVDGDGDLDLVTGNIGQPDRLYLNNDIITQHPWRWGM